MTWLAVILLALATFAFGIVVTKIPRSTWTMLAAVLTFGLAGYAVQASIDLPGAPQAAATQSVTEGAALVEARMRFGREDRVLPRRVTTADAFTRRGQFGDASGFLRIALQENPEDSEAWLALAINLTAQAEGALTPAALYAFEQAERYAPGQVGPGFFRGAAKVGNGAIAVGREDWAQALENASPDAYGRAELEQRLALLDQLVERVGQSNVSAPQR